MRRTEVHQHLSCDRCNTRVEIAGGDPNYGRTPHGWLGAETWLSESANAVVGYDLCPDCRERLSIWMSNAQDHGERRLIERLADILYPMDEYADTQWNGADVCDLLAGLLDEVAPWARKRQPEGPDDAFAAYKRERERLGL
jgi:uncharacterized protein YlaI